MTSQFVRLACACLLSISAWLSAPQPAAAAPPLSLYGNLPGFEMAAISPSGDRIAIVGVIAGERRFIVLNRQLKVVFTGELEDLKVRQMIWAGDDFLLVMSTETVTLGPFYTASKAEMLRMTVVPMNPEQKPWAVFKTDDQVGGIRGYYGVRERDGRWYGYFSAIAYGKTWTDSRIAKSSHPILYEVDLQNREKRRVGERIGAGDVGREWLLDGDGVVQATLDFDSDSGEWTLKNAASQILASGVQPLGEIGMMSFGRDANAVVYETADLETGAYHQYEAPLTGGAAVELAFEAMSVSFLVDRRTRRQIGYVDHRDAAIYHFYDPQRQKMVDAAAKAFPGLTMRLVDWNDSFDRLIVRTDGPGDPQTWWVVDMKTGQADELGSGYPMKPQNVGLVSTIAYRAADGLAIGAVLTLPPGRDPKNLPVIVLPHGGPAARDYPVFDWWAQALASRGYAVLQPNFRGSTGYGAAFERAGDGEWGRKMQTDMSDGLAYLAAQGIADPKRACIVGASYGGYAALAGVTLQQGVYRCAVSVAGIGDVFKLFHQEMSVFGYDATVGRILKRDLGKLRDLKAVSPINFVGKVDAPILLIHGKDDVIVRIDQSRDMESALRGAGKTVELLELKSEDHWLSRGETRLAMLEATVTFVEKYNPPDAVK